MSDHAAQRRTTRSQPRTVGSKIFSVLAMGLALVLVAFGVSMMVKAVNAPATYEPAPTVQAPFDDDGATPTGPDSWHGITPETMKPGRLFIPSLGIYTKWTRVDIVNKQMTLPSSDIPGLIGRLNRTNNEPVDLYAGHVSYNGVKGALYKLSKLQPGAHIYTTTKTGARHDWVATSLKSIPKAPLDSASYVHGGLKRLVLVTCGGKVTLFTLPDGRKVHTYSDNVVATAISLGKKR